MSDKVFVLLYEECEYRYQLYCGVFRTYQEAIKARNNSLKKYFHWDEPVWCNCYSNPVAEAAFLKYEEYFEENYYRWEGSDASVETLDRLRNEAYTERECHKCYFKEHGRHQVAEYEVREQSL